VVGCSGRYRRLGEVEEMLTGARIPSDPTELIEEAAAGLELDFPARMGFSAEYLKACAAVELRRTLASALASKERRVS
jgi:hypothetical protein